MAATGLDSVRACRDAVRTGDRSAVSVCEAALARIDAHDPLLHAFNTVIREQVAPRPTVAIADWAGSVPDEDLSSDGVHPAFEHEDAMARIVAPMLTRWWNATTADELGCGEAAPTASG